MDIAVELGGRGDRTTRVYTSLRGAILDGRLEAEQAQNAVEQSGGLHSRHRAGEDQGGDRQHADEALGPERPARRERAQRQSERTVHPRHEKSPDPWPCNPR